MNSVILMGRLTKDPSVRQAGETTVTNYTLAVDRPRRRDKEREADFIRCVAFGRRAEFAEKYFSKGLRVCVRGRIQTGSYTNKDGIRIYTTDVVVDDQQFADGKRGNGGAERSREPGTDYRRSSSYSDAPVQQSQGYQQSRLAEAPDGFINIPDGLEEDLPFA